MKYALIATTAATLTFGVVGVSRGQAPPRGTHDTGTPVRIEIGPGNLPERRARIGIVVSLAQHDTDSIGVLIEAVTPGGPADHAGIRSGDLIAKVDGRVVGSTTELPAKRLAQSMAKLEPYDTVMIEFYRARNRQTVPVITAPAASVPLPGPADDSARNLLEMLASPLADLSLAPLNPELGQYFGTAEGVLVISSPAEAKLGLKGGDVILSINGRKLDDPDQALRILRNRRRQPLTLDVLRNRRHLSLRIAADTTGR